MLLFRWIFKERQDIKAIKFRFKDKEEPESYVCDLASDLHYYPLPDVLTGGYLLSAWRPDLVHQVLDLLTPDRMRVMICAQQYEDRCTETERWFQAKYISEKITEGMLDKWKNCGMNEKLILPDKNLFIPEDFSLVQRHQPMDHPQILKEDAMGRLWMRQDTEFLLPKNYINIDIKCSVAYSDPTNANRTYMLTHILKEQLEE